MKKVLLHIGQSKTGTSTLQQFFLLNRAALLDKGIHYPDLSNIEMHSHNALFVALRAAQSANDNGAVANLTQSLLDALSDSHLNLLSSEVIAEMQADRVAKLFAGCEVEVVHYIRHDCDALRARYLQRLQFDAKDIPLSTFLSNYLKHRNRTQKLDSWHGAFGSRHKLAIYDRSQLKGGDILEDFLTRFLSLSTSDDDWRPWVDINPSLTVKTAALKQYMNANPDDFAFFFDAPRPVGYRSLGLLALKHPGIFLLPVEHKDVLTSHFEARQAEWAARHFGGAQVFDFENYSYDMHGYHQPPSEREELTEELRGIFADQLEMFNKKGGRGAI